MNIKLNGWLFRNQNAEFLRNHNTKFYELTLNQLEYDNISEETWIKICSTIHILTIHYCFKMSLTNFYNLLKHCTNLKHIRIYDHFPPLGTGYKIESFLRFNWEVENISHFEMFRATAIDNKKLTYFINKINNLEHLHIKTSCCMQEINITISEMVNINSLKSLYLIDSELSLKTLEILNSLHDVNFKITKFGYTLSVLEIPDQLATWFNKNQRNLKIIELGIEEDCIEIEFMKKIIQMLPELMELIINFDGCSVSFKRKKIEAYFKQNIKCIMLFNEFIL